MTDNYILLSEAETERLQLQARVWEKEAERMLDEIGIRSAWKCLDLGCGAMGILGPLNRRIEATGQVIGGERAPDMFAAAQSYLRQEGLCRVQLLLKDAFHTGLKPGSFDFVHERFVLPYVPPIAFLEEMLALTRPGGVIAVQEPDNTSWNFFPHNSKWSRLKQIIISALALKGDIDIGQKTFGFMKQLGLKQIRIRAATLALPSQHPYMRMAIVAATTLRPVITAAQLATDAELDDLLAEVAQLASSPDVFQLTFTVTQVWGTKPIRTIPCG